MDYEIIKNPMGLIQFSMNKGDKVTAEAAAMVFMRGDIETVTRMRKGGFLKSLKAAALGGESFFVNDFIANQDNCSLGRTGNTLGDIEVIHLNVSPNCSSLPSVETAPDAVFIEIVGPGIVYLQTKSIMEFVRAIIPFLPKSRHYIKKAIM